jgi:hypothetical protein
MGGIKQYIHDLMADPNGSPSSKRFIIFLCTILMATAFIANLFWKFTVEEFMFNAVMYIVIGGMGITGVEKFAPKAPTDNGSN